MNEGEVRYLLQDLVVERLRTVSSLKRLSIWSVSRSRAVVENMRQNQRKPRVYGVPAW